MKHDLTENRVSETVSEPSVPDPPDEPDPAADEPKPARGRKARTKPRRNYFAELEDQKRRAAVTVKLLERISRTDEPATRAALLEVAKETLTE
jgi:hypothetical protein